MKAILYEMSVALSNLDFIHRKYTKIKEIFIPSWNMCFNSQGFAMKTTTSRYKKSRKSKKHALPPDPVKLKTIYLDPKDFAEIERLVYQKTIINRLSQKYFGTKPMDDKYE